MTLWLDLSFINSRRTAKASWWLMKGICFSFSEPLLSEVSFPADSAETKFVKSKIKSWISEDKADKRVPVWERTSEWIQDDCWDGISILEGTLVCGSIWMYAVANRRRCQVCQRRDDVEKEVKEIRGLTRKNTRNLLWHFLVGSTSLKEDSLCCSPFGL